MSSYDTLHRFEAEVSQIVRYVYFRSLPRAEQDLSVLRNKLASLGEMGRGFYDAVRGIYVSSKERDQTSLYMKLYKRGVPQEIRTMSEKFKGEAYRSTVDEYERGFLIAWEISAKELAFLKENYPDYPLKEEGEQSKAQQPKAEEAYEVAPRKKPRRQGRPD
ncbi:MAG: hypothetical protein QFX35_02040 [Candidatus Verstraetearchaeota archaeon]|nr:hypothetical protein [Candidatus Verstraetearchaeota archaeon]